MQSHEIDDTGTITSNGQFAAHGPWRDTLEEAQKDAAVFLDAQARIELLEKALHTIEAQGEGESHASRVACMAAIARQALSPK